MKILHTVEFYEPHKGGAEEVIKQLSERLVSQGHEVTVATTKINRDFTEFNKVKIQEFSISGNQANGIKGSAEEIKRYQNFLNQDFDIVLNYAAQNWTTDLALPILKEIAGKKVLVPCGYSGLFNKKYEKYFKELPGYLRQYDSLVYMSENYQDKIFGDQHELSDKATLIPNAASEEEFSIQNTYNFKEKHNIKTKYLIITVSNHYLAKGHRFVIKAFEKMKRRDTTLVIIGQKYVSSGFGKLVHLVLDYWHCKLSALFNKNIRLFNGTRREAVISAYNQADIFFFGSRIECAPLVVYESFASKTPFITRDVGNIKDFQNYLKIVKSPQEMAKVANDLLNDPKQAQELAKRAQELYKEQYTWKIIAKKYLNLYKNLHGFS